MRKIIFSALVLSVVTANAQTATGMVGINTENPKATLHIEAGDSESKGLIIPRITPDEMKAMSSLPHFGQDQHAIITYLYGYMPTADQTGKLENVAGPGYYFYNHSAGKWQKFGNGEQDLRMIGVNNHLTQDAGIGGNGTSLGASHNSIAIGPRTFYGFANISDLAGSYNIAMGQDIYYNNGGTMSGTNNMGIGNYLYYMQNGGKMQGGNNVALGIGSFGLNKANAQFTGNSNMALGYYSFSVYNGDLTGSNNTAIGNRQFSVSNGDFTGSYNTAIGDGSFYTNGDFSGNRNIALGQGAMHSSGPISGSDNIAIGNGALYGGVSGLTGSNNIAIGRNSNNIGEGNGNITIASYNGADTPGVLDNAIIIGNNALLGPNPKDGTIAIGNSYSNAPIILGWNSQKVGIGTPDPKANLDVNGNIKLGYNYSSCTSDNAGTIEFRPDGNFYGCTYSGWKQLNNN